VQFEGIEYLSQDELTESVWNYLHKRHFLLFTNENRFVFDDETLLNHLESYYSFEYLNIILEKNHVLTLSLKEKTSGLLWNSQEKTYVVDLQGLVIREISREESEWLLSEIHEDDSLEQKKFLFMPRFRDLNDIDVTIGENILTSDEINAIFLFQKYLNSQFIPFIETQIDRLSGKWMGILAKDGYLILFDAYGDIDTQAKHLASILSQPSINPTDLEYIDVRFGDHVYYK